MSFDLLSLDATAAAEALAARRVTSRELTDACIASIEWGDHRTNAVVVRDFERARQAADEWDRSYGVNPVLPLGGVPVTVKESFDVEGLPTTWGVEACRGNTAKHDAVAVQRLRAAGAIILGKTNVPTWLAGFDAQNPIYGRTSHPHDPNLSPGGSSSGSAVAVAAGFSLLDLGSDLSGSIRHPAHFCGVYGHSPSRGLIPSRGHAIVERYAPFDMSEPGPLARSARDLKLALSILAGPDSEAAYRLDMPPARREKLGDFRILVLEEHPMVPTAPAMRDAVRDCADLLERWGCRIVSGRTLVPDLESTTRIYLHLLGAALSTGQDADGRTRAEDRLMSSAADSFDRYIARGALSSHADWLVSLERRARTKHLWHKLFLDFDAVICPAFPLPFLTLEQGRASSVTIDRKETPIENLIGWAAVAKAGDLPGTIIPWKLNGQDKTVGVQIIGPNLEDFTPIRLAELIAEAERPSV